MAKESDSQIIARLERENADKQQRINRGLRDLDGLMYRLASGNKVAEYQMAREAQERLRGGR